MDELTKLVTSLNLSQVVMSGALLMARIIVMVGMVPFLGGKIVPGQIKLGIALSISIIIYPIVLSTGGFDPLFVEKASGFPMEFKVIGFLIKEIFVGFLLGFIIQTIWDIAEMVGRFVDTARGSSMGTALVPQMKQQVTQIGSLYYQIFLIIFLSLDGHLLFLEYFIRSYQLIPIVSIPRFDTGLWPLFHLILRLTADLFVIAIKLSAPVLVAIFVTDLCMALFNKVAPQINIMFLMMPFKAMLGIAFSLLGLTMFAKEGELLISKVMAQVWTAIQIMIPF